MSQLEDVAGRRRGDGFAARELLRDDREHAACWACRKKHPLRGNNADQDYADFAARHPPSQGCVVLRVGPERMRRAVGRTERRRRLRHDAVVDFAGNASVLEAFQASDQSLDLTSFNSLASSATAGWSSPYVDNSSNLYLDLLCAVTLAAVNTAPASDKQFYLFAACSLNTTDRPATGAASSGVCTNSSTTGAAMTFPSISTLTNPFPMAFIFPYPVQNAAQQSPLFSVAKCFGGWLGLYHWLPVLNFSGMTIAASANAYKYRGVFCTVA